ncbi:hypothetical protein [Kiloniella majae]|uniref:hypothetical protein n=1 Tax=Kiloniella majae TaxID=1938558 RepID=UPI000A278AE8|nr:hypothetical protein [Kiloniella majae]
MPRNDAEQLEDFLESPFIEDFSEATHRVRRNLLFFSSISLFILLNDLHVGEDAKFLGFTIKNLSEGKILWGIFLVVTYHFVHFIWMAYDHYTKYTLRLTGVWSKNAQIYKDVGNSQVWSSGEAKISTLFSWIHIVRNNYLTKQMSGLNEKFDRIEKSLGQIVNNPKNISHLTVPINTLEEAQRSLDSLTLNMNVIEKKLHRFDNKAFYYARINSLKWLILEYGLPAHLGAYVLGLSFGRALSFY